MKKTRWLSLFTAGVLALGLILSGCSSSEGQSSQESSSSQTEENSQVTETKVPPFISEPMMRRGTAVSRSSRL